MTRRSIVRALGAVTIAASLMVALGGGKDECERQCMQQAKKDQQACDKAYTQKLKDLAKQQKECDKLLPGNPTGWMQCTQEVERQRSQAFVEHERCIAQAQYNAVTCLNNCSPSPSKP